MIEIITEFVFAAIVAIICKRPFRIFKFLLFVISTLYLYKSVCGL